jgi:hypothetical protein
MLKKLLIFVSVLSLYAAVFAVWAQPSVHQLKNDQYVNVLELPWFEDAETFKAMLNAFYNKPADASWFLRVGQFDVATPYYKDGLKEYELPVEIYMPEGILRSFSSTYDPTYYETLVKRISEDFTDGGYIETSDKIFHTYTRVMAEDGIKVTVEIVMNKNSVEPVMFDATCEKFSPPKEKINEPIRKNEKHRVDVLSAALKRGFGYCLLLSINAI